MKTCLTVSSNLLISILINKLIVWWDNEYANGIDHNRNDLSMGH